MKKVLLIALPILFCLTGCMDMLNEDKDETIEPVSLQDSSGESSPSGLLNMSWEDMQVLAKSVLMENGIIDDYSGSSSKPSPDVAMIVNNKELLKDVELPSSIPGVEYQRYQWPEIDFEHYSLVVGKFEGDVGYYRIVRNYIVKHRSKYELNLGIQGIEGVAYHYMRSDYFYASLYPKLPDIELEVKSTFLGYGE